MKNYLLIFFLIFLTKLAYAKPAQEHHYPFDVTVSILVEKSNQSGDIQFFGQAAGRCAAMFRSMHVLLAQEDPSQPHPTLENYYTQLIDVYREIAVQQGKGDIESEALHLEQLVKNAKAYLGAYTYWMSWNKRITGNFIENSSGMQQELSECRTVLNITGVI